MKHSERYNRNGRQYIGVTDALKIINNPQLNNWRGDVGNETADGVRELAAGEGKYFDKVCTEYDIMFRDKKLGTKKGKDLIRRMITEPEKGKEFEAYITWFERTIDKILLIQEPVFNDQYLYAGTPDLEAICKGERHSTMFDRKYVNNVSKSFRLQLAAYQQSEKEIKARCKTRAVIWLKGDFKIIPYPVNQNVSDWFAFLNFLAGYRWWQSR